MTEMTLLYYVLLGALRGFTGWLVDTKLRPMPKNRYAERSVDRKDLN
jgi:hypothetical protein